MDKALTRSDLLSAAVPLAAVAAMAILGLALWWFVHRLGRRMGGRAGGAAAGAAGFLVGTFAVWACDQALGRLILLASTWPLWLHAALSAGAVEGVTALYARERRVTRPWIARLLLPLRLAALLLAAWMLLQPVFVRMVDRVIERHLVVLLDDSESMHFADRQMTTTEKLQAATVLGAGATQARPRLDRAAYDLGRAQKRLLDEVAALGGSPDLDEPGRRALLQARKAGLKAALEGAASAVSGAADQAKAAVKAAGGNAAAAQEASGIERRLREEVAPLVEAAGRAAAAAGAESAPVEATATLAAALKELGAKLNEMLQALPRVTTAVDDAFYAGLEHSKRREVDTLAASTRERIARALLAGEGSSGGLIEAGKKKYRVHVVRFAAGQEEIDPARFAQETQGEAAPAAAAPASTNAAPLAAPLDAFRQRTDVAAALERAVEDYPPDALAGVLLLTDGRHNGPAGVEAVARRLGGQGSPVCAVVIGGTRPPPDAAVLNLRAPDRIYLTDRVRVAAEVKADALRGKRLRVTLRAGDETIGEQTLDVPEDACRLNVQFFDVPKAKGVRRYMLEVETPEGDIFPQNNRWDFNVAVTDDRTNVLLVDEYPRWEFRYLRNLFYGRDKSVHLQYVMLKPDTVAGSAPPPPVAASARRKFGDAEATALPRGRDEWILFDAIIIGDVPASLLDDTTLESIRYCVAERGALLVVIGGARHMPHEHAASALQELLPIRYETTGAYGRGTSEGYRVALTPEGAGHPIMSLSESPSESAQVWQALPPIYWRQQPSGIKEGASVLAYAEPLAGEAEAQGEVAATDPESLARQLREIMQRRTHNALIVAQRYGLGRVLMIDFDETWRLRYRVGDTYHHRFWGQVMRWGAGENLRSGTELVRLGSDRLTYTPDEPVRVIARLTAPDRRPVEGERLSVMIGMDGRSLMRRDLEYRKDSNGIYEAVVGSFRDPGRYTVRLEGRRVAELAGASAGPVETEFLVVATKSPVELAELTADADLPGKVATLSGGDVASPANAAELMALFGEGSRTVEEKKETTLWDTWMLLLLVTGLVTAEWILRKRGGLT